MLLQIDVREAQLNEENKHADKQAIYWLCQQVTDGLIITFHTCFSSITGTGNSESGKWMKQLVSTCVVSLLLPGYEWLQLDKES